MVQRNMGKWRNVTGHLSSCRKHTTRNTDVGRTIEGSVKYVFYLKAELEKKEDCSLASLTAFFSFISFFSDLMIELKDNPKNEDKNAQRQYTIQC